MLVTNLFLTLWALSAFSGQNHGSDGVPVDYLKTAEDLLRDIYRDGEDVYYLKQALEKADSEMLAKQLGTDQQKKAFWINVYNAYILDILKKSPEKYNDRSRFFKDKQISIAGTLLSFADIEHGILRRSKNQYSLGFFNKWNISDFEKKMRVDKVDYRIHFALNCGAASCPPVQIYEWTRLDDQLNRATRFYLSENCTFDENKKTVFITPLFSWFRKDFGGLRGVKKILLDHNIVPNNDVKLKTTEYDWTLDLNNFSPEMK